jgi:CBS domain-containing protein
MGGIRTEFHQEIDSMQIRDIMTTAVVVMPPDSGLGAIARKMRDEDIGSVPIAENDRLVGMVTDRDIVIRALADGADMNALSARSVMSPQVLYCRDDQTVDEVLTNMGDQQVRRLPVVDRDKRLVGMVSLGDLSRAKAKKAGDALKDISQPGH